MAQLISYMDALDTMMGQEGVSFTNTTHRKAHTEAVEEAVSAMVTELLGLVRIRDDAVKEADEIVWGLAHKYTMKSWVLLVKAKLENAKWWDEVHVEAMNWFFAKVSTLSNLAKARLRPLAAPAETEDKALVTALKSMTRDQIESREMERKLRQPWYLTVHTNVKEVRQGYERIRDDKKGVIEDLCQTFKARVESPTKSLSMYECLLLYYLLFAPEEHRLMMAHFILYQDFPRGVEIHNTMIAMQKKDAKKEESPLKNIDEKELFIEANGAALSKLRCPLFDNQFFQLNMDMLKEAKEEPLEMSGGSVGKDGKRLMKSRAFKPDRDLVSFSGGFSKVGKFFFGGATQYSLYVDVEDNSVDTTPIINYINMMVQGANDNTNNLYVAAKDNALMMEERIKAVENQRRTPRQNVPPSPRRSTTPRREIRCYTCGKVGHIATVCTMKKGSGVVDIYSRHTKHVSFAPFTNCNTAIAPFPRKKHKVHAGDFHDCLNNVELDAFLSRWKQEEERSPNTKRPIFLEAACIYSIFENPQAFSDTFRSSRPVVVPFHFENEAYRHWAAVYVHEGTFYYIDSAPGEATLEMVIQLWKLWQTEQRLKFVRVFPARQPRNSNECGVHMLVNLMAMLYGGIQEDKNGKVSYGQLRPIVERVAEATLSQSVSVLSLVHGARYLTASDQLERGVLPTEFLLRDSLVYLLDRYANVGLMDIVVLCLKGSVIEFHYHTLVKRRPNRWTTVTSKKASMVPFVLNDDGMVNYLAILDVVSFRLINQSASMRYPIVEPRATSRPSVSTVIVPTSAPVDPVITTPAPVTNVQPSNVQVRTRSRQVQSNNSNEVVVDNSATFTGHYSELLAKNVYPPNLMVERLGDQVTVRELKEWLKLEESDLSMMPHLFAKSLAETTRKAHMRVLRWLAINLEGDVNMAIDSAILTSVQRTAAIRKWAPTTMMTKLTSIHGALKCLFLYRPMQVTIKMGRPRWNAAINGINKHVQTHKPNQPKAITEDQVHKVLESDDVVVPPKVKAAIEIAWLTAARGGDVRQIRIEDIQFPKPLSTQSAVIMTVTFRSGKTASRKQYAVGAPMPSQRTLEYIQTRKRETENLPWAFPRVTGEAIRSALRTVDPQLEQRSLRRGRLQFLADKGWTEAQLKELSNHASEDMVRRYLDMGIVSSTTRETALRAADTPRSS